MLYGFRKINMKFEEEVNNLTKLITNAAYGSYSQK